MQFEISSENCLFKSILTAISTFILVNPYIITKTALLSQCQVCSENRQFLSVLVKSPHLAQVRLYSSQNCVSDAIRDIKQKLFVTSFFTAISSFIEVNAYIITKTSFLSQWKVCSENCQFLSVLVESLLLASVRLYSKISAFLRQNIRYEAKVVFLGLSLRKCAAFRQLEVTYWSTLPSQVDSTHIGARSIY